jgi:hypothetical protein
MLRCALTALCFLMLTCTQLSARWKAQYVNSPPDVQVWYGAQHNQKGEWCCDKSDGHAYFGDYRLTEDGGVELQLNGKPHKLPAYMLLKGQNPMGHAVWWYTENMMGHVDYCFTPGILT